MVVQLQGRVFAYRFDERGLARRLADDEVPAALGDDAGWCWIHLNLSDQRARRWLEHCGERDDEARAVLLASADSRRAGPDVDE